jgi:hypothetical protein
MSRQIGDRGDFVTKKEKESASSAPTPRVTPRAGTQTDSRPRQTTKPKVRAPPDSRKQVRKLMEEGVHSTAAKVKDDTIAELADMLLQQMTQNDAFRSDIQRLIADGQKLRAEFESTRTAMLNQERIDFRVRQLHHLSCLRSDDLLVSEIERIERDIQQFITLSEPWLLKEILDGEDSFPALVNLKFRRLEDLVYGMRRQLLQDREVTDVLPFIIQKFGSMRNLLAKYNEGLDMIDRLRVREFKYSTNELVRRRQLGQMDVPALHLLVVTLQNELIEALSQVRSVSQILGASSGIEKTAVLDDHPVDFDLIREYNLLEAKHKELEKRNSDLARDYELLKAQVTLDIDIAKSGPLRMYDQLKAKLRDANRRIEGYYGDLEKMKTTNELQQKLMNQFQKEKAAAQRQKSACFLELSKQKDRVAECEFQVRTVNRKLAAVRALARMMAENILAKRKDYATSFDNLANTFCAHFERFDSAALMIQRAWRHSRNPRAEKRLIRSELVLPIPALMTMTAIDVVVGKLKPVTYHQVVKLLKSYNSELRDGVLAPMQLMRERIARLHERGNEVAQIVLWRGKRFAWCQTGPSRQEREVQTEGQVRVVPPRSKSRIFNLG